MFKSDDKFFQILDPNNGRILTTIHNNSCIISRDYVNSNGTFSSSKGRVYGGLPDSCPEMHPCPVDIQEVVGIRIPGAKVPEHSASDVDHPDPDGFMDVY